MALKTTLEDTQSRLDALLTYANSVTGAEDTSVGDAIETLANGYGQGGGSTLPIQIDLLGEWTGYLPEYTDTSNRETVDTGISTVNIPSNYLYFLWTIECDGQYSSIPDKAWSGFSWDIAGRYVGGGSNGKTYYYHHNPFFYPANSNEGLRPKSIADAQNGTTDVNGILNITNNDTTFKFYRKATSTYIIMGGNYTFRVYGITFKEE